ncbi:MAG: SurA N-terminal domain-containing protein [Gammaproteobacteria bacterium]|nr:SurA N-terminal domain-containing protein [Gammaproteobacteria bacterium]
MLQTIREKLTGWAAFAVLLVIAVPLALTFVGGDFTVTGGGFAARVNGEDIPAVEFQRVFQNRLVAEQQAARNELPKEFEERLKRDALDGLVLSRVITQFVRDAGFRVSANRVIDQVRSLEFFQVGGQFSKPAYDATLAAQGISPSAFEKEQQEILAVRQLQDSLVESSFFTPAELRRLIALDQERREFAYVLFDPLVLGAAITVSDVEVQSYYAANANQFNSPESVTLEYIEVALPDMATEYMPDEDALRKAFDADPTRFRSDEERRASHILIGVDAGRADSAAKALAEDVASKLSKGGDFAALAAEYSSDTGSASRGGDLGFAVAGSYVEPFEKVLFGLRPGETSAPVKTEFGYHIIRLDELRPGASRSFDEVRAELLAELQAQKAQDEFYALAERLDDMALENPTSLEPVARDTGLRIKRYEGITRESGGPFGGNANLINAVFFPGVLDGSENTPLIEIDDTRAVVARVAEYKLPAPKPLESVRGDIVERLRALRATTEANSRGQAIVTRVQGGEELSAVVDSLGLKLTEAGLLTRRTPVVHPDLLSAVFRASRPAGKPVTQGVSLGNGGYAVFHLRSVAPGEPERIPQDQRDQMKQAMAQRAANGETGALAAQLRESASVVVAPDLFKADDAEPL